jgi:hypothetical protein
MGETQDRAPFTVAHIDDLPNVFYDDAPDTEWKPVRRYFGIGSFGSNLFRATKAGDTLTHDHTETDGAGTRHEELFVVLSGHATFKVEGAEIDAPAGTFLYVPDPTTTRGAVAREAGTVLFAVGAEPGAVFSPSDWDTEPLAG